MAPRTALGRLWNRGASTQQGHDDQHRSHDRRELRACARLICGRRRGKAGVDGEALEQAGADVGCPEGDQLLVGVDFVAVLGGKRAGAPQRFADGQEDDADGARNQVGQIGE